MKKNKQYKVDFFVVTQQQEREHPIVADLLASATGGLTNAIPLVRDEDEKHQIRSLVSLNGGKLYQGVFGRSRYGEAPLQGAEDGREEDVELKPGHGLVEKNHFLFWPERNLLVYQRNPSGSHHTKLQRYFNLACNEPVELEPILTTDSYQRLLDPKARARKVDLSFQQPKDPSLYKEYEWTKEAMQLVRKVGGVSARLTITMGRSPESLLSEIKNAAVVLARSGLARVARVKVEDQEAPIDLIADRVVETIVVPLSDNGRPEAKDIYAALAQAETARRKDLRSFFGA